MTHMVAPDPYDYPDCPAVTAFLHAVNHRRLARVAHAPDTKGPALRLMVVVKTRTEKHGRVDSTGALYQRILLPYLYGCDSAAKVAAWELAALLACAISVYDILPSAARDELASLVIEVCEPGAWDRLVPLLPRAVWS